MFSFCPLLVPEEALMEENVTGDGNGNIIVSKKE
jgi:hypothetical protein